MKKAAFLLLSTLMATISIAQEKSETVLFTRKFITPKADKIELFEQNISSHNKKYHEPGPFFARVASVLNGANTGDYIWLMGRSTFTDLDSFPQKSEHDKDWKANVMPYVERVTQNEYWVRDKEYFYSPQGFSGDKFWVVYYRIKPGSEDRFRDLIAKSITVIREKSYNHSYNVLWNQFPVKNGHNVAIVAYFSNWSLMDEENSLANDFETIYGEGSWQKWFDGLNEIIEWSDNELAEVMPSLSGRSEN